MNKKINFKKYKKSLIWILVLILIMGGVYYYQNRKPEMKLITNSEEYGEFIAKGGNESEYLEWIRELEKQDNYGGKTPEETLELYIKALEEKDFVLASKYFVLEDQERELNELKELVKQELKDYIFRLKLEKKISYLESLNKYKFFIFQNEEYKLIVTFVKNKETNIWKLESI